MQTKESGLNEKISREIELYLICLSARWNIKKDPCAPTTSQTKLYPSLPRTDGAPSRPNKLFHPSQNPLSQTIICDRLNAQQNPTPLDFSPRPAALQLVQILPPGNLKTRYSIIADVRCSSLTRDKSRAKIDSTAFPSGA